VRCIGLGDQWEHPVCQYNITGWPNRSNADCGRELDRVVSRVEPSGYAVV
jgi:hypothetical protein